MKLENEEQERSLIEDADRIPSGRRCRLRGFFLHIRAAVMFWAAA